MRCPICGSGLGVESYSQVSENGENRVSITCYCESCGREFGKLDSNPVPARIVNAELQGERALSLRQMAGRT